MSTEIDIKVGVNLEVGSVPIALSAEVEKTEKATTFTFNGSIQEFDIDLNQFLGKVGQQFELEQVLPPELDLKIRIDYIAAQLVQTNTAGDKPNTTGFGAAAKFELLADDKSLLALQFYGSVLGSSKKDSKKQFVVGAAIDTELKFENLPLVGSIPGVRDLALTTIGFSYTNVDPKDNDGKPVKFPIPKVDKKPNPLFTRQDKEARQSNIYRIAAAKNDGIYTLKNKGFSLTVGLKNLKSHETLNNLALPLALPSTSATSTPATFDQAKTSPPAGPVNWVKVDKTFGPVSLKELGVNYSRGEATFGFSAGFSMAGFELALQGLAITFPMPLPGQQAQGKVGFDLQGLGLNYKKGSLELGGAFLKVPGDDVSSYYGLALVKFARFGLKAIGGYTPAHSPNPASFFLYANLQAPIGGPPFLFITGLAAGFGVNNSLNLPSIDGLPDFIMLPNNAPKPAGSPSDTITKVLGKLREEKTFEDKAGAYWIAAGIQFTSFEMVDAFALVTVSFGVDFKVAVIGSAAMTFPKGASTPVAYVDVNLLASFTPSTGLLAVDAKLSPSSFIYGGFCKLTGGFAFYAWFDGPKKGNFAITLGGYHPGFNPNELGYPVVPRLGMSFGLGPFQVTGQAYFALVPSAMMAGIRMDAIWKSGPIKAWFSAGVDFLFSWAPFHYEAGAFVSIGCSADLGLFTIDVHIGADLQVWGPPFGGRAHVDLDLIAFTIEFGSKATLPPPVGWEAFSTGFLPKPTESKSVTLLAGAAPLEKINIIKATVAEGLADSDVGGFNWIVDSSGFSIVTNSTIPSNKAEWTVAKGEVTPIPNTLSSYNSQPPKSPYLRKPTGTTFSDKEVWEPTLNIGPMDKEKVLSCQTISLSKAGSSDDYLTGISIEPILEPSNTALWALNQDDNKNPNRDQLIPHTLTGFAISPIPRTPTQVNDIPLIDLIFSSGFSTGFSFTSSAVDQDFTVTSRITDTDELIIEISGEHHEQLTNTDFQLEALTKPWVSKQRKTILEDLNEAGFSTYSPDEVKLCTMAKTPLTDWPSVALLGN